MFIAGITLFTRAAIDGGVPEETAYSLSDGYIQTVEECTNSVSIEKLSQRAAARFAQEVYDPRKRMEMIPYLVTSRNGCTYTQSAVFLRMLLFIGGDKQKHFFCFDTSWKGTK